MWSLYADFVMWSKTIQGTMDAEAEHIIELAERDRTREAEARAATETDAKATAEPTN
jgi:hypothetical protein